MTLLLLCKTRDRSSQGLPLLRWLALLGSVNTCKHKTRARSTSLAGPATLSLAGPELCRACALRQTAAVRFATLFGRPQAAWLLRDLRLAPLARLTQRCSKALNLTEPTRAVASLNPLGPGLPPPLGLAPHLEESFRAAALEALRGFGCYRLEDFVRAFPALTTLQVGPG